MKKKFSSCSTPEERYTKIIELGRTLPPYNPSFKTPDHLVSGCQSLMYLHSYLENGRVRFSADSDALISKGLAALLLAVYDDETPETILSCPSSYLTDLQLNTSLSPSRSNGLASLYLRLKQEAVKYL